jgi:hypothetical protein
MDTNPTPPPNLDAELSRAQRRTVQYWFQDGLVEVFVGGTFLLLALYITAMGVLPGPVAGMMGGLLPAAFLLIYFAGQHLVRRAKEGLVYPRTGYISYERSSPLRRGTSAVAGAVVAALFVVLIRKAPSLEAWIPAMNGLFIAALLLLLNRSARLSRLSLVSAVAAVAGLVLALAGWPTGLAISALFAIVGAVMAATGATALRRYLRHAPPPEGA